jgi:hypothetical protein
MKNARLVLRGGSSRRRRRSCVGVAAIAIALIGIVAMPSGGVAAPHQVRPERGTGFTVSKVGTVTVRDLPAATAQGSRQPLPALRFNPAAYAAAKASPTGGNEAGVVAAMRPTVNVGTKLASPLSSDDDPRWTPPDMGFAAGGGFKMEQINTTGRIWNAADSPGLAFDLSTFFLTGGDLISDPWVLFDSASGRWFAAIFDISLSSERLAVSASSDPTGLFHVYNVPEGAPGGCPDQGKVGISDNVVGLSANEFSSCFVNPSFLGVIITVLNKSQLVAGALTVDATAFGPLAAYSSSVVPAQSLSSTTTQWYAGVDDSSSTVAHVVKTVGTPPGAVTLSEPFTLGIRVLKTPPGADQPGTSTKLETNDNRVQTVAWRSGSLVFTNTDACIPRRDTAVRSCSRLLSIDTGIGTVKIDKEIANRNQHTFFPAASINANGTIVVGYGRSSSRVFPELDVRASSGGGRLSRAKTVQSGDAANETTRYGDYFAVAVDPLAPTNVWVAGEVGGHNSFGSGGWGTAIARILVTP